MLMRIIQRVGNWLRKLEEKHFLSSKFIDFDGVFEEEEKKEEDPGPDLMLVGDSWNREEYQELTHHFGDLVIRHNPKLDNLDFLKNLEVVEGDLVLFENPQLTDVGGLSNLRQVNGDLIVVRNPQLQDLTGFRQGLEVRGNMHVMGNPVEKYGCLTSLIPGGQMQILSDAPPVMYIVDNS